MIHQNISDADILCLSGCTETELEEIKKNMEPQEMQHSRNKAGT